MSASFDYYRIFYYVGKTGSITAAANALFLTQPTISHAIRNLEKELEKIDKHAFVIISDAKEIKGEGFTYEYRI